MSFLLGFAIGMLIGMIAIIIRLGIKGNLTIHYFDDEDKPYMSLELDKDVEHITRQKVVVLRVCIRDHRAPQK